MFKEFLENFDAPKFNYQGSKTNIRQWVLQFMPTSGKSYIEPFAGRGNMFFLANKILNFKKWHLNDLNSYSFLQAIKDINTNDFPEKITPNSFNQYKYTDNPLSNVLEPEISHQGHYRAGFAASYGKNKPWNKKHYEQKITQAKEQLQNVKITNLNWETLPYSKYSNEDFIYFDPPYLNTDNRYYKNIDHIQLLSIIKSLKAKWMINMVNHPLYIKHLGKPYQIKERQANLKRTGEKFIECIWKGNY